MRASAVTDMDDPLFRHAPAASLGEAGDDEAGALIDRAVGDHELEERKGDAPIVRRFLRDAVFAGAGPDPGARIGLRDGSHTGPDRRAFRLPFFKALAIGGAACVLVERVGVYRRREAEAATILGDFPLGVVAQDIWWRRALGGCLALQMRRCAHPFAADDGGDPGLARADAVGGPVQETDRCVAMRQRAGFAMRRRGADPGRHDVMQVGQIGEGDLLDD